MDTTETRIINSPDGGGQLELAAYFAEGGQVKVCLFWRDLVAHRTTLLAQKELQSTPLPERQNPWGLHKRLLSSPPADECSHVIVQTASNDLESTTPEQQQAAKDSFLREVEEMNETLRQIEALRKRGTVTVGPTFPSKPHPEG